MNYVKNSPDKEKEQKGNEKMIQNLIKEYDIKLKTWTKEKYEEIKSSLVMYENIIKLH